MGEIIDLLKQLVSIDSTNPTLVPGAAGEVEIARFIVDWFERVGIQPQIDESEKQRPNVVALVPGTGGGRSLMLNAHMDTAGVSNRCNCQTIGDRFYGTGAYDMKGGLAAIMLVAKQVKHLKLKGDLMVAAVVDEEFSSIGSQTIVKKCLKKYHADAVVITEATSLDIGIAQHGIVRVELEITNKFSDVSDSDIRKLLESFSLFNVWWQNSLTHSLLGTGSLKIVNIIRTAQRLIIDVKVRTLPGETAEIVELYIKRFIDRVQDNIPSLIIQARVISAREPFETLAQETIIQMLQRTITIAGRTPKLVGLPKWTDAAIFSAAKVPTVVFGPDGGGAHCEMEWINLSSLDQCLELLLSTVKNFCG